MTASARALKLCAMISYQDLHQMAGRATPDQIMDYKMALQLYKTHTYMTLIIDWTNLNFNQILGTRQMNVATNKESWNELIF